MKTNSSDQGGLVTFTFADPEKPPTVHHCNLYAPPVWIDAIVSADDLMQRLFPDGMPRGHSLVLTEIDGSRCAVIMRQIETMLRVTLCFEEDLRTTFETMREEAVIDALTGTMLRKEGIKRIEEELLRHLRYGAPFSIAMCDLDFFKRINDTYGHLVGDVVLKHAAHIIRNNIRKSDLFIRFGGEEFIILFPQTEWPRRCGRRERSVP